MDLMDKLVSLAKRRGFIFPSSEIYGGLNGAWDYGPLGVLLKRNLKQAWWDDMITRHDELAAPEGAPSPFAMVGLDSALLMNPRVWEASGHVGGFNDPMVDDRETKARYRADQLVVFALAVQRRDGSCHVRCRASGMAHVMICRTAPCFCARIIRASRTRSPDGSRGPCWTGSFARRAALRASAIRAKPRRVAPVAQVDRAPDS